MGSGPLLEGRLCPVLTEWSVTMQVSRTASPAGCKPTHVYQVLALCMIWVQCVMSQYLLGMHRRHQCAQVYTLRGCPAAQSPEAASPSSGSLLFPSLQTVWSLCLWPQTSHSSSRQEVPALASQSLQKTLQTFYWQVRVPWLPQLQGSLEKGYIFICDETIAASPTK